TLSAPRLVRADTGDAAGAADTGGTADAPAPAAGTEAAAAGTGEPADATAAFDADGTVLLTGGTGSLGALVARHLVERHGVRHLVLAGRRGPDAPGAATLTTELTELGAAVSVVACDVSDRDAVAALLRGIPAEHPLTGLVHLAGVLDDGVISALTEERVAGVFAPKATAVRHLDELTRELAPGLRSFVVFSSAAALLGSAGQGNYAAANAYLDALMAHRRAAGLPGVSLAWGLWEQSAGLTAHLSETDQARMSRGGVLALTPEEGMELFDAALHSDRTLLVPAKVDLRGLRADATAGAAVPPLLRGLVRAGRQSARAAVTGDERRRLAEQLAGLPAGERAEALLELVRTQIAVVLGYADTHRVDAGQGLFEIGFDSLTALELRNRLGELTGTKLGAGLVFDHPTPALIVAHLTERMYGEDTTGPVALSV
ncbi:type I polyketide synthase, partial [Streptomyces tricolor]